MIVLNLLRKNNWLLEFLFLLYCNSLILECGFWFAGVVCCWKIGFLFLLLASFAGSLKQSSYISLKAIFLFIAEGRGKEQIWCCSVCSLLEWNSKESKGGRLCEWCVSFTIHLVLNLCISFLMLFSSWIVVNWNCFKCLKIREVFPLFSGLFFFLLARFAPFNLYFMPFGKSDVFSVFSCWIL